MADELPVNDILCEAMEYLVKLGSNLRTRSESLKEKRINKSRLKNAHAVQKAANKVLLICHLSKKSLENVEAGVQKILTAIDVSQNSARVGGNSSKQRATSSPSKPKKYNYFEIGKQKLKITNRISLKHYQSVRVRARNMPTKMLDRYPVYYDCKLFRLRKKHEKETPEINKSKDSSLRKISESNTNEALENKELTTENTSKNEEDKQESSKEEEDQMIDRSKFNRTKPKKKIVISSDSESGNNNDKPIIIEKHSDTNASNIVKDVDSNTEMLVDHKLIKTKKKVIENSSDSGSEAAMKKSNCSIATEDSSSEKNLKLSEKKSESKLDKSPDGLVDYKKSPEKEKKKCSDKESNQNNTNKEIISNNEKNIKPVEASIHDKLVTTDINKEKNLDENCDGCSPVDEGFKGFESSEITKCNKYESQLSENKCKSKSQSPINNSDSDNKKPGIKLVSLSKLLKPTVLQNIAETMYDKGEKKKPDKSKWTNRKKLDVQKKDDEEYWKMKRDVVSKFKSKNFYVKMTRLATFTEEFMKIHGIQRIVSKGLIVKQIDKDNANKQDIASEVKSVKELLLYDSDSDKNENDKEKPIISNKVQQEFVHAASNLSNKNDENKQESSLPSNELIIKKYINSTTTTDKESTPESGKSCEPLNSQQKNEITPKKAKSALLNDSSPEAIQKTSKENKVDGGTPKSRRKKIMESMNAKKILLNYSSSETEDEELNNALKKIRESLLRGNSSDENNSTNCGKDKRESKKCKQSSENDQSDSSCIGRKNKKMGRTKSKPTSSSNQNSDTQDVSDKEIEGLTNMKTIINTRRRRESPSDSQESNNQKNDISKTLLKVPIAENEGLEAYKSLESSEVEDDVEEDLPTVSLSGLNGDGLGHQTKDDLLGESDSSSTQNEKEKSSEEKKDEESEDDNVKLKRRKANAISSDSEVGSSRKKEHISDFEDSEGSSEANKKNKKSKRKKNSDSDNSDGNSSSDGGKKKRRRIKQVDSGGSGSDTENEGRNKHGRKNIRKVMGKDQLEEATKKAARKEKERVARIFERQKLYNNLQFDESGKPDEVVLDKVILDFDPETKEPLIQVDRGLVKKLKPHQANGIKFMWDACFESVKRIKKDKGSGCILAHCMGLGKTLQVISLTHTLLIHSSLTRVNRVLVVCPLSTVLNWVNEFKIWLKHAESDYDIDIYELSRYKQNSERAYQLSSWLSGGGVCVLGYEMFRNLSADNNKKYRKKMLKSFQESLVDPGPDLVVCDEGHLLKNEKTSLSQSMNRIKALRRIVLTGTPLQNNLKEYYCMVQFVKPNLLGKYNEYLNRFVNPITNGQYTDSTEYDIKVMKRRSHVLHKMLDGAVQRRDYGVLAPFLPPKHEYVLFITLTDVQVQLYQHYLDNYSRRPMPGKSSGFLFPDFQSLQRIWTHPLVLKYNSERYEIMQQKKRDREEEEDSEGSLADFIDDDSSPEETSTEESSDDSSAASDDSRKKTKKKKAAKKGKGKDSKASTRRGTRANPTLALEDEVKKDSSDVEEVKNDNPTEWWIKLVSDAELDDLRNSHKLLLLFDILRQCEAIGDKLLVFSQSLYSLDLIEHFLGKVDEATQEGRIDEKLAGHVGSWSPGIDYFRLDGSTSCENRSIWCKNFNREDNPRARLFLISTRAGGLGINLVAANRVVIFDVSWNPSHDVQSIFRVYRFGQKKPCYVYRFLAMGTMEEKIYERQVTKQAISKRVIDEQQIDRHYAENDLAELYKFSPRPETPRELPPLPKDRLFAEMLKDHEAQIYKYHEHDSLLENKEEETLSEEERKAAWEDFENEKNKPPPQPFVSNWNMHNGMAPGLLAAQQQQLAYAALATMLRKDMPNINEQQIRDMLPLICNSNPAMFGGYDFGLMQKMNDIYKYAGQPGMMNPAMMNPMSASAMGGASGLQYSPPWQRQQQQQQQMRLQQMLQQQNTQAAKYYAGGLGSRDPVAMALQQQRAREIMLGEHSAPHGAPRARGRPRAPPPALAPVGDVVNLDSD